MGNPILCLGCGRMFSDIESARDHGRNCSHGSQKTTAYLVPSITFISQEEINEYLKKKKNKESLGFERLCPLDKPLAFGTPPCPQCRHCGKVTNMGTFLKAMVQYNCRYPDIVSKSSKQISLEKEEIDPENPPFSQASWDCPFCYEVEAMHYDYKKGIFICLNCVKILQFDNGIKILEGLDTFHK